MANATEVNLGRQNQIALNVVTAYVGGAAVVGPAFVDTSGLNGCIMVELVENNVAGSMAVTVEGSYQNAAATNALWYAVGYYTIVSNTTVEDTLTRAHAAITLTQNGRYVLQVLDAYPNLRVRVTSNASNASLTANLYGVAG